MPAVARASRSRRAVARDTSSSAATSAAVTRPRDCMSRRVATNRSARTTTASQEKCSEGEHFRAQSGAMTTTEHMFRGLANVSIFADDLDAARTWYTDLLGLEPYFVREGYVEFRVGDHHDELGIVDRRFA